MANEETNQNQQSAEIAKHIAAAIKDHPNAEVRINPTIPAPPAIPQHIAGNLLEFLRRVESKGMEAVAWVEAYQFVQQHVPQQQQPQQQLPVPPKG